jgi:toxin-antitoxin system PIN domain toxin
LIVPDANLLLYAYNLVAPQHTIARNWLESTLSGNELVLFPWPVLSAFLRISTSSHAFHQPLSIEEAIETVNAWMGQRNAIAALPTDNHWLVLSKLLKEGNVRGAMTTDAEIAAYAVEHGATLYTCDRGFARFPDLKFINPLA